MFRNESCALASLLAPWAIAACGSSGVTASTSERDGGRDDGSESPAPSDASASPEAQPLGVDVTLPSATAFADVNIEADFTQPVDLPPPARVIAPVFSAPGSNCYPMGPCALPRRCNIAGRHIPGHVSTSTSKGKTRALSRGPSTRIRLTPVLSHTHPPNP
jgi:hypothetical protein